MNKEFINFISYTGDPQADIFHYISLISLCTILISTFKMLWYLNSKGLEKNRLYSFNPFVPFDYLRVTRNEAGKVGIWFKVFSIAILLLILSEITLGLIK